MEREQLVHNFSQRLTILMEQAGFKSYRSKAGVQINTLAMVSGCSIQMARRYVLGEALPDIDIIYKIATWLEVPPGWLLFGDESISQNKLNNLNLVKIDQELLKNILMKCASLFDLTKNKQEVVNYIIEIIHDAMHIEVNTTELLKIIDLSINSIKRFHGLSEDVRIKAQ